MTAESRGRGRPPVYYLTDGTPLLDAVRQRGLNRVTVYSRIRRGLSPDEAVSVDALLKGKRPVYHMSDGRPLAQAIRENDCSRRCVYYDVKAGASPDEALAAVVGRRQAVQRRRDAARARRLGLSD